ncbi:tripartite tricarboxylate transporter TctB family protein [Azospirillum sp.]|uniref:tripartite tricarboxylate transporter TctB family protein n=1 Tax=Azospirillum sp. TaxID=34012 RepID=UPI002D565418|nr:tripartite tricarboxylate transporter TctB family protein [Azospirillum sp.]HYF88349.1 tripartite tricarboxylate transporter TctB family protein [Azospirillum sp.]
MSNAPAGGEGPGFGNAMPLTTKIANLVISVVLIAIAASAIAATGDFPKSMLAADVGAARFPIIHAGALIVLCLILIANTLRTPTAPAATGEAPVGIAGYAGVALGMLATAGCIVAMEYVGYGVATAVYMAVIMALMGQRSPVWNPVLAVGVTAIVYGVFHYALQVPLPVGSLFE